MALLQKSEVSCVDKIPHQNCKTMIPVKQSNRHSKLKIY